MTEESYTQISPDRELTLKDLILAFQKFRREAFRKWWLYGIVFLVIGGALVYRALATPVTYEAKLTFMVNEDEGNPFGGVTGLLGQFGLGRGRGGRYNLDKIVQLAKSRRIVQEVLLTKTQGDYIGNQFIVLYDLDDQWAKDDSAMAGFRFTRDSVAAFNEQERKALLSLYALLAGSPDKDGLMTATYDDESSVLTLTCETTDEQLSIDFARTQFDRLSEFYIDQATERQLQTFNVVREKVDSIQEELTKADMNLAVFSDASNGMWSRVDLLKRDQLQREINKLSAMQVEAVKNMEYAEFSLKNAKPVIQEIDIPISPLQPLQPSLLKALVIAAAVAFILTSLYLIGRKAVREAMA